MPTIAFVAGTSARSRARRALRLRSPRDTPLPLPMNVLLLRWDTKPDKRIRRTFPRPASTRRTSFYAAVTVRLTKPRPSRSVSVRALAPSVWNAVAVSDAPDAVTYPGAAPVPDVLDLDRRRRRTPKRRPHDPQSAVGECLEIPVQRALVAVNIAVRPTRTQPRPRR